MGILMAVYLATATSLCAWGTIRGHEEQMAEKVGWMDMYILGNDGPTDEQLRHTGFFRKIAAKGIRSRSASSLVRSTFPTPL